MLGSEPEPTLYRIKVLSDVRVRMRDGVELAVKVIRPDVEGKFPTVMTPVLYRRLTLFKEASSEREYSTGLNASHYLAERGYATVNYDVREFETGD